MTQHYTGKMSRVYNNIKKFYILWKNYSELLIVWCSKQKVRFCRHSGVTPSLSLLNAYAGKNTEYVLHIFNGTMISSQFV